MGQSYNPAGLELLVKYPGGLVRHAFESLPFMEGLYVPAPHME
jgi:hypothetical protein